MSTSHSVLRPDTDTKDVVLHLATDDAVDASSTASAPKRDAPGSQIELLEAQEHEADGQSSNEVDELCCNTIPYGKNPWDLMPYKPERYKLEKKQLQNEIFAGLTVAFAQVSESVAFAFIAGVEPLMGLHAAWIIGLSVSIFGSRPGLINGATGVRAAVIAPYVAEYGIEYMFYIVIMISFFQFMAGILKLAKFVRLVPRSVMIGFVNGLAIILAMGQVLTFRDRPNPNDEVDPDADIINVNDLPFINGAKLWFMLMYIVIVATSIIFIPKIPSVGKVLPASLIAIGIVTIIEWTVLRPSGFETPTIGEVATVQGGWPKPFFTDPRFKNDMPLFFTWKTLGIITLPAFIASAAGAVEAVMTMEVVNDRTESNNESPNQQLIALSIGNFISGIYGTMGGGATIGLSVINCTSGANGWFRLSGIIAGIAVLLFVLVASPFIEAIPTASLVGVMVIVIHGTFDWESAGVLLFSAMPQTMRKYVHTQFFTCFGKRIKSRKIKRTDAFTIILVMVVTLLRDLFVAVVAGIALTAIVFAWEIGLRVNVDTEIVKDKHGHDKKIYRMHGPLFFASAQRFVSLFTPKEDPSVIEIHFVEAGTGLQDFSAIHALNVVGEKYGKYNKRVVVRHLNPRSRRLLHKTELMVKHFTLSDEELDLTAIRRLVGGDDDEGDSQSDGDEEQSNTDDMKSVSYVNSPAKGQLRNRMDTPANIREIDERGDDNDELNSKTK